MNVKKLPNILFKWIPLTLVGFWSCQALYSIYNTGLFTSFRMFGLDLVSDYFQIGSGTLHASTALIGYTFFIMSFLLLRKIPIPHRTVLAFTFPVFGLLFYDLVHAIADFFITNRGQPLIQCVLLGTCFLVLHFYNRQFNFLRKNIFLFPLTIAFIVSFTVLILSGFFTKLYLGLNPHDYLWLFTKLTAVWLWIGVLRIGDQETD